MQARAAQRACQTRLVNGILVAVQEADRHGLRPMTADGGDGALHDAPIERLLDATVDQYPLRQAEPSRGGHRRLGLARLERVQLGPRLATDLEDVLEAMGGEQHDARPTALEQRIGRDGGAVVQARGAPRAQAPQAFTHRARRVVGRGAQLQHRQPSPDEGDEVGERAARVDADDDLGQVASAEAALDSALDLPELLPSLLVLSLLLSLAVDPLPSPEVSPFSPVFFPPWAPRP